MLISPLHAISCYWAVLGYGGSPDGTLNTTR